MSVRAKQCAPLSQLIIYPFHPVAILSSPIYFRTSKTIVLKTTLSHSRFSDSLSPVRLF